MVRPPPKTEMQPSILEADSGRVLVENIKKAIQYTKSIGGQNGQEARKSSDVLSRGGHGGVSRIPVFVEGKWCAARRGHQADAVCPGWALDFQRCDLLEVLQCEKRVRSVHSALRLSRLGNEHRYSAVQRRATRDWCKYRNCGARPAHFLQPPHFIFCNPAKESRCVWLNCPRFCSSASDANLFRPPR
ncbi:hypothetical protein BF49_5006 [Bradyrhizobium sp.]|nr:hypothetical protein BF49_5006 [Bradyrhizobium sp.]